jgi:hypothetical protein
MPAELEDGRQIKLLVPPTADDEDCGRTTADDEAAGTTTDELIRGSMIELLHGAAEASDVALLATTAELSCGEGYDGTMGMLETEMITPLAEDDSAGGTEETGPGPAEEAEDTVGLLTAALETRIEEDRNAALLLTAEQIP